MDTADVNCFEKAKGDKKSNVAINSAITIACDIDKYDTTNDKMGIALIFGHNFKNQIESRDGNEIDQNRIFKILRQFGFDVRNYSDLCYKEITEILEKVSQEDHIYNNCLVVVAMSHGEKDVIRASDGTYKVDMLWQPFMGDKCQSLINKPKFFFIQACRGDQAGEGVQLTRSTNKPGLTRFDSCPDENKISFKIPSTADLLIMYSTFEGTTSFRNETEGSWFIQCLAAELEKSLENGIEIHDLLRTVSRKVAYSYQSYNPRNVNLDKKKQMPTMVSTLTKFFYLKRKI